MGRSLSPLIRPGVLLGLVLFIATALRAQNSRLAVQPGSTMIVAGGALVLNNTDLLTDGAFDASAATVWLTGPNNTFLGGAATPVIQVLKLNTSSASTLSLNGNVQVSSILDFLSGLIDLNSNQLQLTGNAVLQSESETSHLTGLSGGTVTTTATGVSNPLQLNIGNLGAALTTSANIGTLTISRSQQAATNPGNGALHGIDRTFLIQPQNNTALNATLRLYYLNEELNGDDPSTLSLWKSSDGVSWMQMGADSRNTVSKYVEKTGLADLSYWTLTDLIDPLPLTLVSFKAICQGTYAVLQWQTAVESNIDGFVIERSADGTVWTDLGEVACNNDPNGSSYMYKDSDPQASAFYRLKIIDRSGNASYSPVFRGGCSDVALPFLVYPNPTHGQAVAQVSVREAMTAKIELFTISGQLVSHNDWPLQPGINQYVLSVAGLAAGSYLVKLSLNGSVQQAVLTKE